MTAPERAVTAKCLHCDVEFTPSKAGHVYHSARCRHLGPREPGELVVDRAAVDRLFDPRRDPDERVRDDDWFGGPPHVRYLYAYDTVRGRRRWYRNLHGLA